MLSLKHGMATMRRRRLPVEQVISVLGMAFFRDRSITEVVDKLDLTRDGGHSFQPRITNCLFGESGAKFVAFPISVIDPQGSGQVGQRKETFHAPSFAAAGAADDRIKTMQRKIRRVIFTSIRQGRVSLKLANRITKRIALLNAITF